MLGHYNGRSHSRIERTRRHRSLSLRSQNDAVFREFRQNCQSLGYGIWRVHTSLLEKSERSFLCAILRWNVLVNYHFKILILFYFKVFCEKCDCSHCFQCSPELLTAQRDNTTQNLGLCEECTQADMRMRSPL